MNIPPSKPRPRIHNIDLTGNDVLRIRMRDGSMEFYVLQVCLINTKHDNGAPALCTFIRDDQTVDLAGGEEFMTAWCPKKVVQP